MPLLFHHCDPQPFLFQSSASISHYYGPLKDYTFNIKHILDIFLLVSDPEYTIVLKKKYRVMTGFFFNEVNYRMTGVEDFCLMTYLLNLRFVFPHNLLS